MLKVLALISEEIQDLLILILLRDCWELIVVDAVARQIH